MLKKIKTHLSLKKKIMNDLLKLYILLKGQIFEINNNRLQDSDNC